MPDRNLVLEGVRIIFKNFAGKETPFNRAGDRNFAVLLNKETADMLALDGWPVKVLNPREEGDDPQPYLKVAVKYGRGRPPRAVIVTDHGTADLDESTISTLDWADITNVDLILRPYEWNFSGKSGVKAYLQSIYATINEDPLERKYFEGREAD